MYMETVQRSVLLIQKPIGLGEEAVCESVLGCSGADGGDVKSEAAVVTNQWRVFTVDPSKALDSLAEV
ncbi:unnamed protein product [Pleuronectes platessa]|uniref:Uncharacterized protein n=1 Tax=Pleuronectes platessa TaxID=8262 RepID=A0A9N7UFU2_PLEPL|nr:unnamed protein product [Pleuronectes platessa]